MSSEVDQAVHETISSVIERFGVDPIERQAAGLLLLATKKAKIRLGRAWNTLPHLREPETAKIMLEIIAAKEVTDSTGAIAVRAAQMFAEQSEEK